MFGAAPDQNGTTSGPVLGIDPGLSRCGYGAVRGNGAHCEAVVLGVLRTDPGDELPVRLASLAADLETLVREVRPSAIAVERVLFQVNVRTAMSVGQVSGLLLAIAGREHIPVVQYSPNEVKLAVAGDGGAGKEEVQAMVTRLLGLREVPRPADAADALALALCHQWRAPLRAAAQSDDAAGGRLDAAIAAAVAREVAR
ncbi:MAG: crossover junction endodeoxyribonuclease RuvC [Acidimicrobiia bacterium]